MKVEQETDEYAAKYGHSKKVAALSSLQQTLMNQNKTALLFTQGGKTHHIWGQRDTSDEEHKTDFTERERAFSAKIPNRRLTLYVEKSKADVCRETAAIKSNN